MRACVRACVRAFVRACVRFHMVVSTFIYTIYMLTLSHYNANILVQ